MPNAPRTPTHNVRVPEEEWQQARAIAAARGESLAEHVLRPAIRRYIRKHSKEEKT
jgi:hypothetical protein